MKIKPSLRTAGFAVSVLASSQAAYAQTENNDLLEELVVTAELLETNVLELPNSVSVIGAQQIQQRSAQHLEDLLNLAPNVNFASGASRGRLFKSAGSVSAASFRSRS